MEFLTNFAQQITAIWQRSSIAYRVGLVGAVGLAVVTVLGVGWWASRPQYMPLAHGLSPTDAAAIRDRLDAENIPSKLSFSASTVSVPEGRWNDAKMAVGELLGESGVKDPVESSLWGQSPEETRVRLHRDLERKLARSISSLNYVMSADVNLAVPPATPFSREQRAPKANVTIVTRRGAVPSTDQGQTIATMVASSVDGLTIENVTVTHSDGATIFPNGMADASVTRNRMFRLQLEDELVRKAEELLASTLGPGKAVVKVTADVDFTETDREVHRFDKEGSAKRRETISSTETKDAARVAAGPAGAASNVSGLGGGTGDAGQSSSSEDLTTEWDNGKTIDHIRQFGGVTERLTVSAMVDLPDAANASGSKPLDLEQVKALIKAAVGFDEERGDLITVTESELVATGDGVETLVDTLNRWDFYNNLARNASLGLAAIVALVLGLLLIRKLQPIGSLQTSSDANAAGRSTLVDELSKQVRENPEIVSQIVTAWLNTPDTIPMNRPTDAERQATEQEATSTQRAAA